MEKIKICSDSVCDLSPALVRERNIAVVPLHVILGEDDFRDGVDITPQDIFDYVARTGVLPKTSAVTVGEYTDFFEEQLKDNDKVILFTISQKCSSSYDNATAAAAEFGGRVKVIDSEHLSTGQGLLAMKAADLNDGGEPFDSIVEKIEGLRAKVQTSFVVDTTEYLYKGGRCTAAARVVTALLPIRPAIRMANGALGVMAKYMGTLKRCITKYVGELAVKYPSYDDTRVFITHSCCNPDIVDEVKRILKEKFAFKEIVETFAGSVVTSHCGKGTLGVLYITQ